MEQWLARPTDVRQMADLLAHMEPPAKDSIEVTEQQRVVNGSVRPLPIAGK